MEHTVNEANPQPFSTPFFLNTLKTELNSLNSVAYLWHQLLEIVLSGFQEIFSFFNKIDLCRNLSSQHQPGLAAMGEIAGEIAKNIMLLL